VEAGRVSDGIIDLVEGSVITNRRKHVHQGRTVTSFVAGSERLFRFVNDNRSDARFASAPRH
jgi:4-hydroxybutyrate CoA-transferase